jgi:hypothetical protein
MTKRHVSSCLVFVAVAGILFASTPSFAQFRSAIEGNVVDSSGAAVAGAQVVLTNQDNGVSVTATSNETGLFRFPSLGLGKYTLTATKAGFQTVKQENIALAAEETRTVPLVLKVGAIQETVTITEDAAAIQLAESKIASGISSQEITELPLTGRNIFNLVSMTPGVTAARPTPTASEAMPTPSTSTIHTRRATPIRAYTTSPRTLNRLRKFTSQ